jgi:hypothetical protein
VTSIEITDTELAEMEPDHLTPVMAASPVSWYALSITVHNIGEAPLYVISSVRRMSYDESTRVLTVEFVERESPAGTPRQARGPVPPKYKRVDPGQSTVLTTRLSSPLVFLEATDDGPFRRREVRLFEEVASLDVQVASDPTEPTSVGLTALRRISPFAGWGEIARQSWRLTLSTEGGGKTGTE